jgi:hypothetical protein
VVTRRVGTTRAVTTTPTAATADRDRCRHLLIFRHRAIEEGKLKGL